MTRTTHLHPKSMLSRISCGPFLIVILTALFPTINAGLLDDDRNVLSRRGPNDNSQGGLAPQIWVPIIVVVLILAGVASLSWTKRNFNRALAGMSPSPILGLNTREVTAEQLANGSADVAGTGTEPDSTAQPRSARRPRRNRRTPSQISTRSLPAYMKEPGDEELVISRGPQDLEDSPPAQVMPPVEEHDSFTASSGNDSGASLVGESPDTPLLQNEDSNDITNDFNDSSSRHLLPPRDEIQTRRSIDTNGSSDENSSLMRAPSRPEGQQDPRGEAPPYFEVVDLEGQRNGPGTQSAATGSPVAPPAEELASRRRSGLRSFFHAITPSISRQPASTPIPMSLTHTSTRHTREASAPSVISVASSPTSHGLLRRPSAASMSTPFRPSSHRRSATNLNNTSQVSLNSISAPLTHTLVRTEFTYPKAGPTPQQLKLISSRESFARFGIPYGPDAIAYAASTSMHELGPPPGFDDSSGSSAFSPSHRRDRSSSSLAPAFSQHRRDASTGSNNSAPGEHSISPRRQLSPILPPQPAAAPTTPENATAPSAPSAPSPARPPLSGLAPPTSFPAPQFPTRSESRASSMMSNASYATAVESMSESRPQTPTTPTTPVVHVRDQTDTTINQATA